MQNGAVIREAEQYILSCIIQFYDYIEVQNVFTKLCPEDFTDENGCRDVFNAALKLHQKGVTVDLISLGAELGDSFYPILTNLVDIAITCANINYYIRVLQEQRQRERIRKRITEVISGEDVLGGLAKIIEDEQHKVSNTGYYDTFRAALAESVQRICSPLDPTSRIGTGFLRLDNTTGKFEKRTISYIGAYPSCGKTAFAINVITHNLKSTKNKCAFFSLEMSVNQIYERVVADRCNIDYNKIRFHKLDEKEQERVGMLYGNILKGDRLVVIDNIYYVEEICRAIADLKPDYVVIDFMHCIRTIKRCDNRRNEVDYISQSFKECAKKNNCHIIILCQVSRPEKGVKRAPRMSDLKESGGLEQDGDYIIMLHRPYVLDKTSDPCEAHILIDKNKYGDTGQIEFSFMGHFQRFVEHIKDNQGRC